MRRIAVAAILIGSIVCATGLLIVPLTINGFQYHEAGLLSGRNLHISPQWGDPASGYWLDPQTVTIRASDPLSYWGRPERILNLTPLSLPTVILGDSVVAMVDITVTGDPVNVYIVDQANMTVWDAGQWPWTLLALGSLLGHWGMGAAIPREEATSPLFLILEATNTKPPTITVFLSLSFDWTPSTGAPDAALEAAPTPTLAEASQDVRLEGDATSANGTPFEFLVLERTSWEQWSLGHLGRILFEGTGNASYRFIVPLESLDVQGDPVSFVVRNPGVSQGYPDLEMDVNVSAHLVWWEPPFAASRPFLGTFGVVMGFAGIAVAAGGVLLELTPPRTRPADDPRRPSGP